MNPTDVMAELTELTELMVGANDYDQQILQRVIKKSHRAVAGGEGMMRYFNRSTANATTSACDTPRLAACSFMRSTVAGGRRIETITRASSVGRPEPSRLPPRGIEFLSEVGDGEVRANGVDGMLEVCVGQLGQHVQAGGGFLFEIGDEFGGGHGVAPGGIIVPGVRCQYIIKEVGK